MVRPRGARRLPDPRRRILAGRCFGFRRTQEHARVASLSDVHRPDLPIVWEKPLELPVFDMPAGAQVFARERWTGAPLLAGFRRGAGAVLWVATPPGERGYERFPYLLQALADLGLDPPFRSSRLWAFFDSPTACAWISTTSRARWRKAGIAALHVAAWHFFEPVGGSRRLPPQPDRGLPPRRHPGLRLAGASAREREVLGRSPGVARKDRVGQDAHLDWRKLMNLADRDCFRAVGPASGTCSGASIGTASTWPSCISNPSKAPPTPARFTPMNGDVRSEFQAQAGFDPVEIFGSARTTRRAGASSTTVRTSRAACRRSGWANSRPSGAPSPHLDLVLTHVDDRFDTGMRDAIGADAARVLPLLDPAASRS